MQGKRGRCSLAAVAVAVLAVVVITQTLFLISLMHTIHNEGALESEESKAHSFTPDPAAVRKSLPAASLATWGVALGYLEHPDLPKHYHTKRTLLDRKVEDPASMAMKANVLFQERHEERQPSVHRLSPPPRPLETTPPPMLPPHTVSPLFPGGMRSTETPIKIHVAHAPQATPPSGNIHVNTSGDIFADVHVSGDALSIADVDVPKSLQHLKDAAVVILCYNRPQLLERAIDALRTARLSASIKKYISQDGDDGATRDVARRASDFSYLTHPRTLPPILPTLDEQGQPKETPGTMYLAAHYKWVLDQLFRGATASHSHVIILEDDMRVSHDVLEMFEALTPILDMDPSVWCISSWNDNGFRTFELPKNLFVRSSYFPGLGWMLKRSLWVDELSGVFPTDNWDHWMRATTTSRNRECISPWLSRNYNMGSGGATANEEFYALYLEPIQLHRGDAVRYGDLRYLLNQAYYADMQQRIAAIPSGQMVAAPTVTSLSAVVRPGLSVLVYYQHEEFELLAQSVGIHPSPRSFYRRAQWLKAQGGDVFLVDRRLSPFAPQSVRLKPSQGLVPVKAPRPGINCLETCSSFIGGGHQRYHCAPDQFDFINDCNVLASFMDGCPNGCTQGWGEDIPNTEVKGVGHPPLCLATEVVPTCEASFHLTQRLCPCVSTNEESIALGRLGSSHVVEVAASTAGMNCDQVCGAHRADGRQYRCAPQGMQTLNRCDALRSHFPCNLCARMEGSELPSYVSNEASGNFGKCFYGLTDSECSASHPDTKRLCPCTAL
jgi:hypothetical protein